MTKPKKNKNIRISKYSNSELNSMEVLDVYKLVLKKEVTRFPLGFWERPEAIENSIKCAKYMIDEILQWDIEDIKNNIRMKVFVKYKLGGMMKTLYRNSPYEILSKIYPNKFMPWELHEAPTGIWKEKENRIMAMDWLINTKLKWSREDIINNYNNQVLIQNNLGGLLSEGGEGSAFKLLDEFMEGEFKTWELKSSSATTNYWSKKENRVFAIKNLIENILKWDEEDIKKKLNQKAFIENDLRGLLMKCYKGSVFLAIDEAYPNKFQPFELSCTPTNYWSKKENRVKALKWLFEIKLKWSIDDIKRKISNNIFKENNFSTFLTMKNGLYEIIKEAYPEIKEWELPYTNASYWEKRDNRIKALDYLFNEKLKWSIDDIKANISQKIFRDNNMQGLIKYYNGSPYKLICDYLPNENIKAWELSTAPNGFWKNDENCVDAIKWMIEKYNINNDNINIITKKFLENIGIYEIVKNKYKTIEKVKEETYNLLQK